MSTQQLIQQPRNSTVLTAAHSCSCIIEGRSQHQCSNCRIVIRVYPMKKSSESPNGIAASRTTTPNTKIRRQKSKRFSLLMIGDSNRVLIVVEDKVKKNERKCRSLAWQRLVASRVQKATSRGFLTEVAFLSQKLFHESWHLWRRLVACCNESLLTGDNSSLLTVMRFALFSRGFLTVIWGFFYPSIFYLGFSI